MALPQETFALATIENFVTLFSQPWFLVFMIPILGAVVSVLIAKFSPTLRNYFSILTIAISAVLAAMLVFAGDWTEYILDYIPSTAVGTFFKSAIVVDPLSAFVALIAAGLGTLIALFSLEYMKGDEAETRYYFLLQLFVGGMVLLVLAGDLVFLYFGWKIVGICSYFLIGHWFHKPDPQGSLCAKSGIKAFLMTLVGDILLLAALGILWLETGTINIAQIATGFGAFATANPDLATLVALFVLVGAIGKSAQFPLITWLSSPRDVNIDAMQGPTTVSALIHAATMVKAGVYLMSRFYFVFGPSSIDLFIMAIALVAAITAFIAAASALVAIDIKRVLAYSTVSQLAYMFMGLAIGYLAFTDDVAISIEGFIGTQFHLMSHAIFKALLFLAAGAIIHSVHEERNIKKMGGLKKDLPILHWTTLIGVCGLAGVPLLFNGSYSKEMIIGSALEFATHGTTLTTFGLIIYIVAVVTALITAIYAFRFFFLIFYGEKPEGLDVHKPGIIMRGVTSLLALLVIVTGLIGPMFINSYFAPMFNSADYHNPAKYPWEILSNTNALISMVLVIGLIAVGFVISFMIYFKGKRTIMPLIKKYWLLHACHEIAKQGFYLDTIYQSFQDLFMWLNWKLRKLQTGDLNYNMSLVGLIGLFIVIFLLFI
ncbi:MAG: NADH-quinone oxidoreductase subunit 5 family protein [Candidatus Hodarchaeales archaeon]